MGNSEPRTSRTKPFILVVLVPHAVAETKVEPLCDVTGLPSELLKSGDSVFALRCHGQNVSVADKGKVSQLFGNFLQHHVILPAVFQDLCLPFTKIVLLRVGFGT